MAITESDIKLLASERLNDDPDGGGYMTGTVVPDGVENNLFPDISDADRVYGRVLLRKVYVAVTSADDDVYMGAHVILDEPPADPGASALMVTKSGYAKVRADLAENLNASSYKVPGTATKRLLGAAVLSAGITTAMHASFTPPSSYSYWTGTELRTISSAGELTPGDILGLFSGNASDPIPAVTAMEVAYIQAVAAFTPSVASVTLERAVTNTYNRNTEVTESNYAGIYGATDPNDYAVKLEQDLAGGDALRFYGQSSITAAVDLGDAVLPIVSSFGQFIPVGEAGAYPTVDEAILGVDASQFVNTGGRVQIFRKDEAVVLHHTATTSPMTVTNGQDVDLGRERLSKVRVYGNDGLEINGNFTPNLTTGHVVFGTVSGFSQPITIKHRIEDMLLVAEATEQSLTVGRAVTHDFPSGSKVSSVMMFGDMQARVHPGFQQATWTGVFSDSIIGSGITADYNEAVNPIVVTNAGAITERWAIIFTSSTTFKVVGEQVGEILTGGSTSTPTAPLNPATGVPYFTIAAAGWGTGWATGNVRRVDTDGANAPVWVILSIAPSDPFVGQDSVTLAIRGNVNA